MASVAPVGRNRRTALIFAGFAAAMLALGFASVPLYRMFCQATGWGGTTQRATESDAEVAARIAKVAGAGGVVVRFDGSIDRGMPWRFAPEQTTQQVSLGQRSMAFFVAKNLTDKPITGRASFNVAPDQAGKYFNKIQCFCFTEQTLQPGEEVRMPVLFYVDPKAKDDPDMKDVQEITLSYTFHQAKDAS